MTDLQYIIVMVFLVASTIGWVITGWRLKYQMTTAAIQTARAAASQDSTQGPSQMTVLLSISAGLVLVLLAVIGVVGFAGAETIKNADNILSSTAAVAGLKLGDCLSTLVAIANGRSITTLGQNLAVSSPTMKTPEPLAPVPPIPPVSTEAEPPAPAAEEKPDGTPENPVHVAVEPAAPTEDADRIPRRQE